MRRRVMIAVYWLFGQLPRWLRRAVVHLISPNYTLGAVCMVRRDDGAVLLVRHSYNERWGAVGGLAKAGEAPDVAAIREAREEVGIDIVVVGEPTVLVLPRIRRIDVVFLARPAPYADPEDARPSSAEILETRWFPPGAVPELSFDTTQAWAALSRAGLIEPQHTGAA